MPRYLKKLSNLLPQTTFLRLALRLLPLEASQRRSMRLYELCSSCRRKIAGGNQKKYNALKHKPGLKGSFINGIFLTPLPPLQLCPSKMAVHNLRNSPLCKPLCTGPISPGVRPILPFFKGCKQLPNTLGNNHK